RPDHRDIHSFPTRPLFRSLVKEIGTKKAWEIFLNSYKTGFYADLAAAQLAKLLAGEQGAKVATLELPAAPPPGPSQPSSDEQRRSEEHTSELQSRENLVCR